MVLFLQLNVLFKTIFCQKHKKMFKINYQLYQTKTVICLSERYDKNEGVPRKTHATLIERHTDKTLHHKTLHS